MPNCKDIRHLFSAIAIILFLPLGIGCTKNGTAVEESFSTDLNFQAVTIDNIRLGIKIDGELKVADLEAPTVSARQTTIRYFHKEKRITIYDMITGQIFLDSLFVINAGTVYLSLYQEDEGAPVTFVVPPVGETAPPFGYNKMSVVYTAPILPDQVKLVVMNIDGPGPGYAPTDSFLLQKGKFSPYFLGRLAPERPHLYFYTPDADRKLLAIAQRVYFADMTTGLDIYGIHTHMGSSNGTTDLIPKKLY